ncbi:hypothetical protein SAMN05661096_01829 [Marivirga sericea]|uniref:Uncharacterized protein n=1 Tax=Marivirga sericea TaxID=1028 RepID=A0A1X7JNA5_9BACT|nr:hypothetical protein [Marivirga sericea]SMG29383.1 hypothetical protein SAMN05661096_01829 [Marivirga sericea]
MKVITIFLSILILCLSAAPCRAEQDTCHEEIESCRDETPLPVDNDKPELPCLPFYSCGSCTGFNVTTLDFSDFNGEFHEQSDFSTSCFQGVSKMYRPSLLKPPKQI